MNSRSASPEWQTCPVCQGRGILPHGFYIPSPAFGSTSTAPEQCRTCRGRAIIQRPDDDRIEVLRAMSVNPLRNARRALKRVIDLDEDPRPFLEEAVDELQALNKQASEWAA